MKRRWKILIGVGIFFVLLAASIHYPPKHEVDAYKALLRSRGEKLELSEVLTAVPATDNSAEAVEAAFSLLDSTHDNHSLHAMEMVAPGKALIGWQQPDARGWDFTNSWDQMTAIVATNRAALDKLRQVLARPVLRFQTGNFDFVKDFFPKLAPMKYAAWSLTAAATLDLHHGDCDAAVTNILASLALIHKDEGDGLEITLLVRLATISLIVAPTWELLQATNTTDAQLAAVQSSWEQLNVLKSAENAFLVERAWDVQELKTARSSHKGFKTTFDPLISFSFGGSGSTSGGGAFDLLDQANHATRLAIGEVLWRTSWSYSDELREIKANQVVIETLRAMQTNQGQYYKRNADAMAERLYSLGLTNTSGAIEGFLGLPDFRAMFDLGYGNVLQKTLQLETGRRIVISAIALRRFQLSHGRWPATLSALAPDLVATAPIDPFDGKPLKYHPNADGTFLLYSIGKDGVDGGGDPTNVSSNSTSFYWLVGHDLVWPQPATPAEVQNYYAHPRE